MVESSSVCLVMSLHIEAMMQVMEEHHPGFSQRVIALRDSRIQSAPFRRPQAVLAALRVIEAVEA